MSFDWYPFNPTDFRRDTYHLCAAADGIYRRLIDEYMQTGRPLPDSDAALAGIARVSTEEFAAHSPTVRALFFSKDGKLIQKRCEKELHAQRMLAASRSKKAKEAATVRWAKDKLKQNLQCDEHAQSNANAMLNDATLQDTKKEKRETGKRICDLNRAELEEAMQKRKQAGVSTNLTRSD